MDTQTLKTFLLLAKLKNFTKTAEQLYIAQSTVTNRISELETELGKALFTRDKRNVSLTAEGLVFEKYAKRIISLEDCAFQDINSIKRYSDTVHIGTTNTIYECHLYPQIRNWLESHPDSALKVTIGHSTELLQAVQDGIMDTVYSYSPLYKKGFSCDIFAIDELILVTRTVDNPYKKGILKNELAKSKYLFCNFALQEVGSFIRELFPAHYSFQFEIDNSTKLIHYLLDLGGISFLPESLALPYLKDGSLSKISLSDFEAPKINCYKIEKVQASL